MGEGATGRGRWRRAGKGQEWGGEGEVGRVDEEWGGEGEMERGQLEGGDGEGATGRGRRDGGKGEKEKKGQEEVAFYRWI